MKKVILIMAAVVMIPAVASLAVDAAPIYAKECLKCHGKEGKGDTKMGQKMGARDYTDPKVQESMTDEVMFKAIKEGFKDKAGKVLMKPAEDLTDEEIKALVAYMRKFKK